jgi:hypothetical protein
MEANGSGVEWCELDRAAGGTTISGVTLVTLEGIGHRVEYRIELDGVGRTRTVSNRCPWTDERPIALDADGEGGWVVGTTVRYGSPGSRILPRGGRRSPVVHETR